MTTDIRQERVRAAFLKTLDRSIDAISGSILAEGFEEELTRLLGNGLHAEFITTFGHAKKNIEDQFDGHYQVLKDFTPHPKVSLDSFDPEGEILSLVNEVRMEEVRGLQQAIAEVE